MLLLLGVAIFSYIMSKFIEMINKFRMMNKELDQDDALCQFLGVLVKFNYDNPLKPAFKSQLESYFNYKWDNDRNLAFMEEHDIAMSDQLPQETQFKLYQEFLFSDFLQSHKEYLTFEKKSSNIKCNFYNWSDQLYSQFMMRLL